MWFLVGMGIALLSTFLTTVSIFILKYSADVEKGRPPWRRYRFFGGLALNLMSEFVLFSFAMAFTPISLLAPLTGTGVVFSALIASSGIVPGVQEKLAVIDWVCTCLVLIGVSIAAIFGPGSNEATDLNALPSAMSNPGFLAFVTLAISIILGWLVLCKVTALESIRPDDKSLNYTIFSGLSASLCGSLCVVLLKVVMVALRYIAQGDNTPFHSWAVWLACVSLAVFAPLQLYLLNSMLASGSVTLSVPLYLSLMVLLVAAGGGLLFSEFQSLPPFNTSMFALSVASVMCGLAVLSFRQQKKLLLQQQLESAQQLRADFSHNANNSSGKSSGKSGSHRDERSVTVRETDVEVQTAVLASFHTAHSIARGSFPADGAAGTACRLSANEPAEKSGRLVDPETVTAQSVRTSAADDAALGAVHVEMPQLAARAGSSCDASSSRRRVYSQDPARPLPEPNYDVDEHETTDRGVSCHSGCAQLAGSQHKQGQSHVLSGPAADPDEPDDPRLTL
mmetsp:Transcript_10204/g.24554  ORF Transcript_10204/g.24554 Transcript_10204/m.24554 type:complete len:508 (-) Transcript_10204:80-1603(-)